MRFSQFAQAGVALSSFAHAAPLEKRALSANDQAVVQLALYLEHLEHTLYTGGCDKFSDAQYSAAGFPAGFRSGVCLTAQQEGEHVTTLTDVLSTNGVSPIPACTYTFPYTDPKSFVDLANMITSVGIGAYLGGAMLLMDDPMLLTEAGSILTVEARHDAFLRAGVMGSPFPNPFDTALSALWAFNLAQQFIVQCPMQLPGVVALPKLTVTSPAPSPDLVPVPAGTPVEFKWDPSTFFNPVDPSTPLYIAIVNQNVEMPIFAEVQNLDFSAGTGSVPAPANVSGAAFACLTTFSSGLDLTALSQYGTLAGPVEIIAS
ncbi:MAG: hypothetical protein M1828_000354 [Chrysothrix sp. TS-e1954]|nr:MAG: hypothetical protein M1828_000354 [Chrysothrix sp. TS-e1954]